jgi:predicted heme/steroid binding protein
MRQISPEELTLADGIHSERNWIAYKGFVYDVSVSPLFTKGKHYNHKCGCDLTTALVKAPHAEELIFKFPIVGRLLGKS